MLVFKASEKLKVHLNSKAQKIGLVPTMGGLHRGHSTLIKKACCDNDVVVVSIYVNPTQFNDWNDLKKYPFDITSDKSFLSQFSIDSSVSKLSQSTKVLKNWWAIITVTSILL